MAKKELKFLHKLKNPHVRKRDGEIVTFSININLTDDEAVALSELFAIRQANTPHLSLIRAFLLNQASDEITESRMMEILSNFKLKQQLSEALTRTDFDKAMSFIKNPPMVKTAPAKERRVFIPEPKRR